MMIKPTEMTPVVDLTHGEGRRPGSVPASNLRRFAATLQQRMPRWGEHPGLARAGPGGQVSRSLGSAGARQPDAGGAWPGLLSPLRGRLQSRRARCGGQHPCRRTLSRRSRGQGGLAFQGRGDPPAANEFW